MTKTASHLSQHLALFFSGPILGYKPFRSDIEGLAYLLCV
jgi:hypothetical protein